MKAETSYIALSALVAFLGSLVLPCSGDESPYILLNRYLEENGGTNRLSDCLNVLDNVRPFGKDGNLLKLVNHFLGFKTLLDDYDNLCSTDRLISLFVLVDAARKANENLITTIKSKNLLSRHLKKMVMNIPPCYLSLKMKWDSVDRDEEFVDVFKTKEFEYFDSKLEVDETFKHLIYESNLMILDTQKEDTEIYNHKFMKILAGAFLEGQEEIEPTHEEVHDYLQHHLINPCMKLIDNDLSTRILRPAVLALAIEMMAFSHEPDRIFIRHNHEKIDLVPSFLICKELAAYSDNDEELEKLTKSLLELVQPSERG